MAIFNQAFTLRLWGSLLHNLSLMCFIIFLCLCAAGLHFTFYCNIVIEFHGKINRSALQKVSRTVCIVTGTSQQNKPDLTCGNNAVV